MSFSVPSVVRFMFLATLLTLPERGCPQCYKPIHRNSAVCTPCCPTVSTARIKEPIKSCFEQPEYRFPECKKHAFIFITVNNATYCVDPAAEWLQQRFQKLQRRGICCEVL